MRGDGDSPPGGVGDGGAAARRFGDAGAERRRFFAAAAVSALAHVLFFSAGASLTRRPPAADPPAGQAPLTSTVAIRRVLRAPGVPGAPPPRRPDSPAPAAVRSAAVRPAAAPRRLAGPAQLAAGPPAVAAGRTRGRRRGRAPQAVPTVSAAPAAVRSAAPPAVPPPGRSRTGPDPLPYSPADLRPGEPRLSVDPGEGGGAERTAAGGAARGPLVAAGAGGPAQPVGPVTSGRPGGVPAPDPGPARTDPGGGSSEEAASPTVRVMPTFPEANGREAYRRTVRVQVDVRETGEFTVALLTPSGDPEIDRCVLAALRKWRWKPALKNGVPAPSTEVFTFAFEAD